MPAVLLRPQKRSAFFIWMLLAASTVLLVDQISKEITLRLLFEGETKEIIGPFQWTLFYNNGIAFGFGAETAALLGALVGAVAFVVLVSAAPPVGLAALSGGLVLGGAIGNLVDRLEHGAVVDFLVFSDIPLVPQVPIFNLADVAITLGVVLLLATVLFRKSERTHPEYDLEAE